ncbi:hypothetical protein NM688_g6214 [Phlebia brevispora]|uniref:Uncharacterized protein n=1 Tax=Phlebia brevispora TaxID=194682 RepID=A0ACC1SIH0_9APHY|nr:hypothetical protein NM688_g6214 [Phlebia brevispora]
MTFDRSELKNYRVFKSLHITHTANGIGKIWGEGDVDINTIDSDGNIVHLLHLQNILYFPDLNIRLISAGQYMSEENATLRGDVNSLEFRDGFGRTIVEFFPEYPGDTTYHLLTANMNSHSAAKAQILDYETAHRCFGHSGDDVLRKVREHTEGFDEFSTSSQDNSPCQGCTQGKMPQHSFPPDTKRATKPFELVYSDVKSFPLESYNQHKYAVTFFDDFTSASWVVCIREKSQVISVTREFLALVETQHSARVQKWMSDAGGEYKSKAFNDMLRERRIEILTSAPHTPQQNGRAERFMRTMMDKAEAMRFIACLPKSWWNFAIEHAIHIYNCTPLRRHNWHTPFELLFGKKPQVERLCVFRCGAWVHIPADVRKDKLEPKSELMVYLGNTSHGWKFMRSLNNVVFTSSQAIFEESVFLKCDPKHKHRVRDTPPAPPHDDHSRHDLSDDDDDDLPPGDHHHSHSRHLPQARSEPQPDPVELAAEPAPRSDPPSAATEDPSEEPPTRRSTRQRNVPRRPGNVYGESRTPTQIERETRNFARWKQQVGDTEPSSSSRQSHQHHRRQDPVTSLPSIVTSPTTTGEESPQTQEPGPASDSDIDAELARLCQEGGVAFVNHLLSQAVASDDHSLSHPCEWTYCDILALPQAEQNEWKAACKQEIEALHKRQVYRLVDRPKKKNVIKNRWVFDVKPDR